MLNAATALTRTAPTTSGLAVKVTATQKVVIVNGSPEILGLLERVLDAGHYDVVFVESNEHAYSQVKRVLPDLVILCLRIEDMGGFQVLSMLKLDDDTRHIPVLTYTSEREVSTNEEEEAPKISETEIFTPRRVQLMN